MNHTGNPHPLEPELVTTGGARSLDDTHSAPPEDCGGPRAFLALRQEHSLWATTVRMAELTTLLLDAPLDSTVRGVLGEAVEELPELLYWSRVDCLDRAAVNRALTGHPTKGAQL